MQEVGTKATSPWSIFAKNLFKMNTAAKEEVYRVENITSNKGVEFRPCLSDAQSEAIMCGFADMDCIVTQLERTIYGITVNYQMQFKKEFYIRLTEF